MSEKAKRTDWDAVERDYRAGLLSNREIGERHGCSEGMVRKKAKALGWTRDLGAKVAAKADDLMRRQVAKSERTPENVATEREIIETNAQAIVAVRMSHRSNISKATGIVLKLLDELEIQTDNRELFDKLGDIMFSPDKNGQDKLNEAYHAVISRGERTKSMKALADSLKVLVTLEREAWSIGIEKEGPGDLEKMTESELDAKIEEVYGRLRGSGAR